MIFWTAEAVGLFAFTVVGYALGRWHARHIADRARPGYLPTPQEVHDHWAFPQAPNLYDQALDPPPHHQTGYQPRSSLGNPLIPDPIAEAITLNAAMENVLPLTDTHSRRVS